MKKLKTYKILKLGDVSLKSNDVVRNNGDFFKIENRQPHRLTANLISVAKLFKNISGSYNINPAITYYLHANTLVSQQIADKQKA